MNTQQAARPTTHHPWWKRQGAGDRDPGIRDSVERVQLTRKPITDARRRILQTAAWIGLGVTSVVAAFLMLGFVVARRGAPLTGFASWVTTDVPTWDDGPFQTAIVPVVLSSTLLLALSPDPPANSARSPRATAVMELLRLLFSLASFVVAGYGLLMLVPAAHGADPIRVLAGAGLLIGGLLIGSMLGPVGSELTLVQAQAVMRAKSASELFSTADRAMDAAPNLRRAFLWSDRDDDNWRRFQTATALYATVSIPGVIAGALISGWGLLRLISGDFLPTFIIMSLLLATSSVGIVAATARLRLAQDRGSLSLALSLLTVFVVPLGLLVVAAIVASANPSIRWPSLWVAGWIALTIAVVFFAAWWTMLGTLFEHRLLTVERTRAATLVASLTEQVRSDGTEKSPARQSPR